MGLPDGITAMHVEQAIDYIEKYGKRQGTHDIFSIGRGGGSYLAVVKDDKRIAIRELFRVTYCFFKDEKPNENGQFTDDQLNLLDGTMHSEWNSHKVRDYLIKLKFKVEDYENVLLLNISQSYKADMAEKELYEATRGVWRVGRRAKFIKYAVAVADHMVREVYEINSWQNAGTAKYETRPYLNKEDPRKKEFVGRVANSDIREELIGLKVGSWGQSPFHYEKRDKLINGVRSESKEPERGETMESKELKLLKQFWQIIFSGPPGTGKTFGAKKLLKELFGVKTDKELEALRKNSARWDIVQFHPSYNYEDFVRGIQAETTNGQVAFEARNKTFGEMCERACKKPEDAYALIIDEINRANVSAVLGELIYALEYRDEEIKTSLKVEGNQGLTIPSNLYIIGTMNTADRTIGQIDYAVRRRFAFVSCPPDKSVITDEKARDFFDDVDNKVFDKQHISQDFDKEDVRIGHSYFLASGHKLANKIIYQVIPILHEYIKDGVLTSSAKKSINEIEESAKRLAEEFGDESRQIGGLEEPADGKGKQWFYWKHKGGNKSHPLGVVYTAREIITDFINKNSDKDVEYFKKEFESVRIGSHERVVSLEEGERANARSGDTKKYFTQPENLVKLDNDEVVVISAEFGAANTSELQWEKFKDKMAEHDYFIGQYHIVSIGDNARRAWKYCHKFGFIAAGGRSKYDTIMKSLKKGDIVFAYLVGDDVEDSDNGVICYGEVTDEAKLISEFKTLNGDLLADYEIEEGQTYQDEFPTAFIDPENNPPDMAVRVKWLAESLKNPFKLKSPPRPRLKRFPTDVMMKLQETFNFDGKERVIPMTPQITLVKDKQSFRWKYENGEYSVLLGVGHAAREILTHFINRNLDKDIEYFMREFKSISLGQKNQRVEDIKNVHNTKNFFMKYPIELNNGQIVVINREWGATGKSEQQWKDFKNKMAEPELGYSIIVVEESGE